MEGKSQPSRILKLMIKPALWLLVAFLLVHLMVQIPAYVARQRVEFIAYFVSSKVIAAGRGAAHFYDNDLFQKEITDLGYDTKDIFYPHAPTTALLFLPLSNLDFQTARQVWVIVSLLSLALALALQFKELKLASPWSLAVISIVLLSQPLKADLWHGQTYTFMLLLTTLTWVGFRRNQHALTGLAYAGMVAAKLFALPLYLLFLLRRCWKAILVSILTILAVALISLPLLTPAAWREFLHVPQRMLDNPAPPVTAYQSLPSFIRHLFTFDPTWNLQPIVNLPSAASVLLGISMLLIVLVTIYAVRISREPDLIFAAVVTVSIFISPVAQDYTYTVLLLPIVILIAALRRRPSVRMFLLAAIAILLYAANLPFKSPRLTPGFWALLAYPKLYAGLIIWSILIWLAIARHGSSEQFGIDLGPGRASSEHRTK